MNSDPQIGLHGFFCPRILVHSPRLPGKCYEREGGQARYYYDQEDDGPPCASRRGRTEQALGGPTGASV